MDLPGVKDAERKAIARFRNALSTERASGYLGSGGTHLFSWSNILHMLPPHIEHCWDMHAGLRQLWCNQNPSLEVQCGRGQIPLQQVITDVTAVSPSDLIPTLSCK